MNDKDICFKEICQTISDTTTLDALTQLKVSLLGKQGSITVQLKGLSELPPQDRSARAQQLNKNKQAILSLLKEKEDQLKQEDINQRLQTQKIDVSLPAYSVLNGGLHPITLVANRMTEYFERHGFEPVFGPEVETEDNNFTLLNIPPSHPARGMHDTFYIKNNFLLRTHTTTMEIRALKKSKPPLQIYTSGKVYRSDSDNTHTPMFHQFEGMKIDADVSMSDLFSILQHFLSYFFDRDIKTRFRPSYFPFTEPSAEVDIACTICQQKKCRVCKYTGWVEVLGCGMLHPQIFKNLNKSWYKSGNYQGYAFGIGIERMAMLKYNLPDLREFYRSDMHFLQQFTDEI